MKINQIACKPASLYSNNKNTAAKTIKNYAYDEVSFKAKKPFEVPTTPQTTINWALNWDKDQRKQELDAQYDKAIKGMSFWKKHFTAAPEELKKMYAKTLEKEEIAANAIIKNLVTLSQQQSQNILKSQQNEAKEAELAQRAGKVSKMEKAARLAEAFKIDDSGNIDELIAGYDAEKQIIRSIFTEQIAMEKAGMEADVPNSILLYGPIGTGKTTFVRAIANETNCELIEMNPDPENFSQEVYKKLKEARERYLNEGRRTIIVLNEIENHLENTKMNRENIAKMKSWLDNCAKLPTDNLQNAYATTFFFTTNHPLEISDEILPREEKIKKLISLEPASEGNIEAIIRFYIQKFDKNGDIINPDSIDYNAIIEKMNPDDEKGAFGNDKIKKIVQLACEDFDKDIDNNKTFEEYLNNRIDKAKRNIKPERLQEFKEQLEELYED